MKLLKSNYESFLFNKTLMSADWDGVIVMENSADISEALVTHLEQEDL